MENIVTIQIQEETRRELNRLKYELSYKTIDETINALIKISKEIKDGSTKTN